MIVSKTAVTRLADVTRRHQTPMPLLAALIKHEHARIDVCRHESGHAITAVVLGGVLQSATVTDGERQGNTIGRPTGLTTLDSMPPGSEAAIAYAGPWSQARGRAGRRPTMRELWAVLDTGGRRDHDALCAAGGTHSGSDIEPLLTRCWSAVEKAAARLFRDGCICHDDVVAALGLSTDPEIRATELAMIRSGSAPGSFSVTRAR